VWTLVANYAATPGLWQDVLNTCKMVLDWCIIKAQASRPDKNLHTAFRLDAVMEQECDRSLAVWLDQPINTMLARHPDQACLQILVEHAPTHTGGQTLDAEVITHAIRQGIAFGYRHFLPQWTKKTPTMSGYGTVKSGKAAFSADNVCAIMSYCRIIDPKDCQVIWTIIAKKKKKNVDACKLYIIKGIIVYRYNQWIRSTWGSILNRTQ
jgi:hypothetical protein